MQQVTEEAATDYEKTYGDIAFLYTGESLQDNLYYRYLDEDNDRDFQKLLTFKNRLNNSDMFTYMEIMAQPVEVVSRVIPDIFLRGYESGFSDYSISTYDDEDLYVVKSLQVSAPFFKELSIEVLDGNDFTEEDYLFWKGKEVPVLLGNAWQGHIDIGDKFEAYYFFEKTTFVVKGFIKEQSFYYSRSEGDFVSCERYMILPSFLVDEATKISKLLLLQQMTGMISTTLSYEQTLEIYNGYLEESGISDWIIYIVHPNVEALSMLDTYSAMTKEVARLFRIMAVAVLLFGSMAMIAAFCGMLKENHFTFGVYLLCGASFRSIALEAIGLVGGILLFGDLLALLALLTQNLSSVSLLTVQAVAMVIMVVSCSACVLYLKRMDISDIIGGRE
jgi:predicted nucleotidyltransferase